MSDLSKSVGASGMTRQLIGARVVDTDGRQAHVASLDKKEPDPTIGLQLEDGPEIVLPLSLLSVQDDDEYHVPISFASVMDSTAGHQQVVVPVVQEQLQINKRAADTGKGLRVRKTVSEREQIVDQPLLQDELIVERVPVGQMVAASALPAARYDGDTLIVPVFEEVLVIEKQTRLKEELRITRRKHEIHAPQTVSLKSEHVSVEHVDERNDASYPAGLPQAVNQAKPEPGKSAG